MRKTVVIALLFLVSGCVTKESLFDKDQNLSGTKVTRDFFGKRTIIWYDDQGIVTKKFSSTSGRYQGHKTTVWETWSYNEDGSIKHYEVNEFYDAGAYTVTVR